MFIPNPPGGFIEQFISVALEEFGAAKPVLSILSVDNDGSFSGTYNSDKDQPDVNVTGKFFTGPEFLDNSNIAQITFTAVFTLGVFKQTKVYNGFVLGPGVGEKSSDDPQFFVAGGVTDSFTPNADKFVPLPFCGTAKLQGTVK
jgi:hypothetical protein